jgi:hypothetical protein
VMSRSGRCPRDVVEVVGRAVVHEQAVRAAVVAAGHWLFDVGLVGPAE